ncbi:MAG: fructosamine kinase family protein [Pseudomonadota bacterium]
MNVTDMAELLGRSASTVHGVRAVSGGDICRSYRVDTSQGPLFVKTQAPSFAAAFAAESDALQVIGDTGAIRVPTVRGQGSGARASWLALEWLDLQSADRQAATVMGESLAAMHRVCADQHGWHCSNFIGRSVQPNARSEHWATFFAAQRLGTQLRYLRDAPAAAGLLKPLAQVIDKTPALLAGHEPQPSLLHGDLWSGNWAMHRDGAPVVFDPAAYFGDRETDLAMTELFGGFPAEFYSAYHAAWAVCEGYERRRDLYQLYHVLNHVTLFGGSYVGQAHSLLTRLLAL